MTVDTRRDIQEVLASSGLDIGVDRFVELVKAAVQSVAGGRSGEGVVGALTASEVAELARGGVEAAESRTAYRDARARTAAHTAALMAASTPAAEAARRLHVDPSRVRQMLIERSLLGFKDGNAWRVLELQFADGALVPNIREVLRAMPEGLALSAAATWLSTPEDDLERGGETVSPLQWLAEGGSPQPVVALASDL